jgi:hypothetical protein
MKKYYSYYKHCLKYGFEVRLFNRIYPGNEPIRVSHDQWKQCMECGSIVPVYEIEKRNLDQGRDPTVGQSI